MNSNVGHVLLEELLADPLRFSDSGRTIHLLQAYFDGFSKETIRPLLRCENAWVQQSVAFVCSELGKAATSLVNDFPGLVTSTNKHIAWYAMEVIAVCATDDTVYLFFKVLEQLENHTDALRRLAVRLASRVDVAESLAARTHFETQKHSFDLHVRCLNVVADERADEQSLAALLEADEPMARRYGSIGAIRFRAQFPQVLALARDSADADVHAVTRRQPL